MTEQGQYLPTKVLQDVVDYLRKRPFDEANPLLNAIGTSHRAVTIQVPDPVTTEPSPPSQDPETTYANEQDLSQTEKS